MNQSGKGLEYSLALNISFLVMKKVDAKLVAMHQALAQANRRHVRQTYCRERTPYSSHNTSGNPLSFHRGVFATVQLEEQKIVHVNTTWGISRHV